MEIHPIASLLPSMAADEFTGLCQDIAQNGLNAAIWTYQDMILDGRHRYQACLEVGVDPRFREYAGTTPLQFVLSENLHRRHLNQSQRAALAVEVDKYLAPKAAARQATSGKGIYGGKPLPPILAEAVEVGESREQAAKAVGGVGHTYVSAAKKLASEAPDLFDDVKSGKKTIPEAKREHNKRKKRDQRALELIGTIDSSIHIGDMRELGSSLPDNSVDLIFTDPPYGNDHIQDYEALAQLGARVLKDGGSLLCYCGQSVLPPVLKVMTPTLTYHWIISVEQTGQSQRMPGKWVFIEWKPILWLTKGARRDREFISDRVRSQQDKRFHEWGQGIQEARYYIEHLTIEGELVLDPFLGGGTTCAAAKQLSRPYIGFEIDSDTAASAAERIARA